MTFQLTTTQALRSFAGAAIFGLSMDAANLVSRHMTDAIWFALREVGRPKVESGNCALTKRNYAARPGCGLERTEQVVGANRLPRLGGEHEP